MLFISFQIAHFLLTKLVSSTEVGDPDIPGLNCLALIVIRNSPWRWRGRSPEQLKSLFVIFVPKFHFSPLAPNGSKVVNLHEGHMRGLFKDDSCIFNLGAIP